MRVNETELPGIGMRYTLTFSGDQQLVLVIRNDRTREVFWRETPEGDGNRLFETTKAEAQKLAEIFRGTYFHTVDEGLNEIFQEARLKWIDLHDNTPVLGQTLGDVGIRSQTGASIIAIQRGETTIPNPEATTILQAGDVLVAVGSEDQHEALNRLLTD